MITLDEMEAAAVAASIVGCAWAAHATALRRRNRTCRVTGLLAREEFERRGRKALRRGYGVVLMVDLDKFKQVNDTYGHAAGNELLGIVGQRMHKQLGEKAVVGHLSGDEFAAVLDLGPVEGVWDEVVNRLVARITEPAVLSDGRIVQVGVSIGVVHLGGRNVDLSSALHDADMLMYTAKKSELTIRTGPATGEPVAERPATRIRDLDRRPIAAGQQPC